MIRLILYSMQSHVLDYTSGDVSHEHYITLLPIFVLLKTLSIDLKITVHEKTKLNHCEKGSSVNVQFTEKHKLSSRLDWCPSYLNIGPENSKGAFSLW